MIELFVQGCIQITTHPVDEKDRTHPDEEEFHIKTVIQPDGDIIRIISKSALKQSDWIESHEREVQKQLKPIRTFQEWLGRLHYAVSIPVIWAFFTFDKESLVAGMVSGVLKIAVPVAILATFKLMIMALLEYKINGAIDSLITRYGGKEHDRPGKEKRITRST